MRRLLLAVLLAGCGGAEPEVVAERQSFRDRSVPIASQVDVSVEELTGVWHRRTSFSALERAELVFVVTVGDEILLSFIDEDDPFRSASEGGGIDPAYVRLERGALVRGRLIVPGVPGPSPFSVETVEFWILWADFDRRTLAIGTPDGSFGFILDRNPTGGEDRIAAALDIMAWMGYRIDEMVSAQ